MPFATEGLDIDDMIAAVDRVAPQLDAAARQDEIERTLSASAVAALCEAKVSMLKVPRAVGGAEASPMDQVRVIERVAQASSSAGWVTFVHAGATGVIGANVSDEAAEKIFGSGLAMTCGVIAPGGQATPVEGGHRVTAHWHFGSGIRHSEWVAGLVLIMHDDAPSEPLFVVAPIADVEIIDNWHVGHLQGTGSCDFAVHDLFVPHGYSWDPRAPSARGGALYTQDLPAYVCPEHLGLTLGIARRALDEMALVATTRRGGPDAPTLAERGAFQLAYGKADLDWQAARALSFSVLERHWATVSAGGRHDAAAIAELQALNSYVTGVCADLATSLHRFAGATAGLPLDHPMQRCARDLLGAVQHFRASTIWIEDHARHRLSAGSAPTATM